MTFTAIRPDSGLSKGPRGVAVERGPGLLVDLGIQFLSDLYGSFAEIGVADEEAFLVVVRVDEPAGDPNGAVASHLACVGMEHVSPVAPAARRRL